MEKDKPKRIQRKRTKGWKMSAQSDREVEYVGRPTKWGNPYSTVGLFRVYLRRNPQLVEDAKRELRDKDLVCWCKLTASCHGDVWLEVANS